MACLNLPDGWTGDAHNLYLELLAETGLVGFLVFGVLIILALRTALKQLRRAENHFNKMIASPSCLLSVVCWYTERLITCSTPLRR